MRLFVQCVLTWTFSECVCVVYLNSELCVEEKEEEEEFLFRDTDCSACSWPLCSVPFRSAYHKWDAHYKK